MHEVIILAGAESDLLDAYARCEDRLLGLGDVFEAQLDVVTTLLSKFPHLGPSYLGRYRKLALNDFPYAVIYTVEANRVFIAAVLHLRQDPTTIRRRLGFS